MMQQINLYRPIFRKQEKKFSAVAMLQAGAAIFAGVVVIYGLMWWQVQGLRVELEQAEKQLAASTKRLNEATRTLAPNAKSKLLADEVAELEKQVAARLHLREVLNRDLFSNRNGYSGFFVALARQHVPGVWLTGIEIAGAGEYMHLAGRTTDPALVPRYVQRLSAEPVIAGREFEVFVMSRPPAQDGRGQAAYVEFQLRSVAARNTEPPR